MNGVKAIIFDLDETLFDRSACMLKTATVIGEKIALKHGTSVSDFVKDFLNSDRRNESKADFAKEILDKWPCIKMTPKEFVKWRDETAMDNGALFPDAIETLDLLKNRGYKLGLISNASRKEYQYKKVLNLGIDSYLQSIVISDDKMRKPDKEIFETSLSEMGFKAEECAFVGDQPTLDVNGAKNVGMTSIFKSSARFGSSCPDADLCIRSLKDLSHIFKGI